MLNFLCRSIVLVVCGIKVCGPPSVADQGIFEGGGRNQEFLKGGGGRKKKKCPCERRKRKVYRKQGYSAYIRGERPHAPPPINPPLSMHHTYIC